MSETLKYVLETICALFGSPDALDSPLLTFLRVCVGLPPRNCSNNFEAFGRPCMGALGTVLDAGGNALPLSGEQWAAQLLPCSIDDDTFRLLFSQLYDVNWDGHLPHPFPRSASFVNEPPALQRDLGAASKSSQKGPLTQYCTDLIRRQWFHYATPQPELAALCPPVDAIRLLWRDLSHSDVPGTPPKLATLPTSRPVLMAALCAVLYTPIDKPQLFDHVRRPAELEQARAANVRNRAVGLFGSAGLGYGVNVLPYLPEHGAMRAVCAEMANAVARQPPWYSLCALVEPMCDSPDVHSSLLAQLLRALIRQ